MAKSILQKEKESFLSGRTDSLEEHHIFYGQGRRKLSERYGRDVPVLRAGADKVDKGHRRIGGIPGEVRGSRTRGAAIATGATRSV